MNFKRIVIGLNVRRGDYVGVGCMCPRGACVLGEKTIPLSFIDSSPYFFWEMEFEILKKSAVFGSLLNFVR